MIKNKKNPHRDHRRRTLETYLKAEPGDVPAHLLLEMMLYYSIPRTDTNDVAHRLIDHFGSFNAVINASVDELTKIEGVGKRTAEYLKLSSMVIKRYGIEEVKPAKRFQSMEEIGQYFSALMRGSSEERMYVMLLDCKNGLINTRLLRTGGRMSVDIDIRKIAEMAMTGACTRIVLAHNHPSGDPEPSDADVSSTFAVKRACDSIGIELAEHFVVSRTGVTPIIEYVARLRKANLDEEDGIFRNTYPAMKNGGSAKKN